MQIVFQDPISSLNPRRTVRDIVSQGPLIADTKRAVAESMADEALASVGLDPRRVGDRKPAQFSGGECQRISLARALVVKPNLLVCDEPVSSLDVSVRAHILNLLQDLRRRFELTMIFVSHDLAVIRKVSDRVGVMYLGKICEVGTSTSVYERPRHPYTRALLDAVPSPDPTVGFRGLALEGEIPSPLNPPSGCRFRTRCRFARDHCREVEPQLRMIEEDHFVACHFPLGEDDDASSRAPAPPKDAVGQPPIGQ
jgi:peptide/nickel transport system ATP-binding protein